MPQGRGYNLHGTVCTVRWGLVRLVYSNTGWRVLMVGGNYGNGSNAGLFYFNANNTSSNANGNIGARLLVFQKNHCAGFSAPLGENIVGRTGFSRPLLERPCRQTRSMRNA